MVADAGEGLDGFGWDLVEQLRRVAEAGGEARPISKWNMPCGSSATAWYMALTWSRQAVDVLMTRHESPWFKRPGVSS